MGRPQVSLFFEAKALGEVFGRDGEKVGLKNLKKKSPSDSEDQGESRKSEKKSNFLFFLTRN
jgi:hypothetical protein